MLRFDSSLFSINRVNLFFSKSPFFSQVDSNMKLGEWAGLCKIDQEGNARKVVKCSCAVVRNWGQETPAHDVLQVGSAERGGGAIEPILKLRGASTDIILRPGGGGVKQSQY